MMIIITETDLVKHFQLYEVCEADLASSATFAHMVGHCPGDFTIITTICKCQDFQILP